MRLCSLYMAALLALCGLVEIASGASLSVRRRDGATQFTAELGQILDMEVVIDAGEEQLTGYSFFLTFDRQAFKLIPAGEDGEGGVLPFAQGGFLRGIELVNRVEEVDGELVLSYTEAAGGGDRLAGTGVGVAARFQLEVMRRPEGNTATIRLESRGHDRVPHYVTSAEPGVEKGFAEPLPELLVRITGFRIMPLPDVALVEGEEKVVFDLDTFVDSTAGEVVWTHSRLSEVPTVIDPRTREVTMSPPAGRVGQWQMIFTAFESGEGLTAADSVNIDILGRPRIRSIFPDTVVFAEDSTYQDLDLDAFVQDVDDLAADLSWSTEGGGQISVSVDDNSHIASFRAAPDFFGEEEISFAVGDADGLTDTVKTLVIVTPVNDPPTMKRVPPIYPIQDAGPLAVSLADLVEDKDDDLSLMQFFLNVDEGLRVEIQGEQMLVSGDAPGRRIIGITVQDTAGAVAEGRQVAIVLGPDETVKPEIERLPEMRLRGGQTGSLTLAEWVQDDSPADSLTWSATPDSGLDATVQNGQLVVGGKSGFAGTATVRLRATDPEGNADTALLSVSLLRPEDGLGPKIYDPGKIGLPQDGEVPLDLDRLVADPDDADGSIIWTFFPSAGLEFDPETSTLRLRPGEELVRPASLTLKAEDPGGAVDEVTVPVLVAEAGGPPQVRDLPETRLDSMAAEARFDLDEFAFDDVDFESELVWTAEAEPGVSAQIDPATHVLVVKREETAGLPPAVTQVVLRIEDTDGAVTTRILRVGLPPLFELLPIPDIEIVGGETDTSLVLDDFVLSNQAQLALEWEAGASKNLDVAIDPNTHRVRLAARDSSFQGSETVSFKAVDPTGRSLSIPVRVLIKGKGLAPQLRDLPRQEIEEGQVATDVDLDDFVVDDDPDSLLEWTASGQQLIAVEIDPATHLVTLDARSALPGIEQIQFLVRDPAGNAALGIMEVQVLRGGQAPVIASLPQMLVMAGGGEKRLDLTPFISDADTPTSEISWRVAAGAGVAARIDGRQLVVSVPAGQSGSRSLLLTATDPQGNLAEAEMQILVQADDKPPQLELQARRHPVFGELIQVEVRASEPLREAPEVRVDGALTEAKMQPDSSYLATFPFAPEEGERLLEIAVRAYDRGGNEASEQLELSLSWMDETGGTVQSPDPQFRVNVPQAATGPGNLAMLYRVPEEDRPKGSGDNPVYAVEMLGQRKLPHPVTLNFFAGTDSGEEVGILRWNEESGSWEEVPTIVDEETGWLSATVDELGLFRLGTVAPENRQKAEGIHHYPNPFTPQTRDAMRIVYTVGTPGEVRLRIYNSLGQPVRLLVDEFQTVGTWSALWNGRDAEGVAMGSGMYLYELIDGGRRHRGSLILVR